MQFKYIAAIVASLSVSSVLAGPMAGGFADNALAARADAALQQHATNLAHQAASGNLVAQDGLTAQQRLDAAHAQHPNVKQWRPYWINDFCCYPGTMSYDYDYARNYDYCTYW